MVISPDNFRNVLTQLDTLLDLHAKLATVVRYYDRMLEERLSKTYGQLSLGGYRTNAPHTSSNMYPSIPSEPPGGQYRTEDYYGVEAPLQGSTEHQSGTISNYYPSSPVAQFQPNRMYPSSTPGYSAMSPRGQQRSFSNEQPPQRAPSLQGYPPPSAENPGATYYSDDRRENYHQQQEPTIPLQNSAVSSSLAHVPIETHSQDQLANYYSNSQNYTAPPSQQALHPAAPSFNAPRASPAPQNQPQSPTIDAALFQPVQPQSRNQQLAQSGYWPQPSPIQYNLQPETNPPGQPLAKTHVQSNLPQTLSYPTMNSYSQDLFPSAPQHQPQPKVVEESLIEL